MRAGIAAFMHESNTFTGELTGLRHFEEAFLHRGAALVPVWEDAHHEIGGFIAGCRAENLEMAPLLAAWATPKGPVTDEAYESILNELLDALREAGPMDGLLLALHGAMVSQSHRSADSETLRRIREVTGPDLPIILSLDMHANIAPPMVELSTATIVYRTYPHVDQRERGVECATLLARLLRGEVRPVQAHHKLPMLMHIVQQYTSAGPLEEIFGEVERLASEPGILSASVAPGYIYADTPHMGCSVIVVADGDLALAKAGVDRLAEAVLQRRQALNARLPDIPQAIAQAAATPGTVCLMDCGDNIGGGGPGDSTLILHALLEAGLPKACAVLYDPKAARTCADAGKGQEIELLAGGKTDDKHGTPVPVRGKIRHISDGRFIEPEPRHGGTREYNQGLTAVIETDAGHTLILNSLRVMPTSLEQLLSLGVDPRAHRFIIVKGVTAPRAAYDPIADAVIAVDSPGVTQAGPESFAYEHRPRPLFPLETE